MEIRYKLRDFAGYFNSGFYFAVCLLALLWVHERSLAIKLKTQIVDIEAIAIFVSLPVCYFTGHLILGFYDSVIFRLAKITHQKKREYLKTIASHYSFSLFRWIVIIADKILSGNHLLGVVDNKWVINGRKAETRQEHFNKTASKLKMDNHTDDIEHYIVLNDLFRGCWVSSIVWFVVALFYADLFIAGIFLSLAVLCWFRAREFGNNYVAAICNKATTLGLPDMNQHEMKKVIGY